MQENGVDGAGNRKCPFVWREGRWPQKPEIGWDLLFDFLLLNGPQRHAERVLPPFLVWVGPILR